MNLLILKFVADFWQVRIMLKNWLTGCSNYLKDFENFAVFCKHLITLPLMRWQIVCQLVNMILSLSLALFHLMNLAFWCLAYKFADYIVRNKLLANKDIAWQPQAMIMPTSWFFTALQILLITANNFLQLLLSLPPMRWYVSSWLI